MLSNKTNEMARPNEHGLYIFFVCDNYTKRKMYKCVYIYIGLMFVSTCHSIYFML